MSVESIIATAISIAALLFTAFSFRRTSKMDTSASAMERATMTADIRYIRMSIDEIKLENKSIQKDIIEMKTKIAEIEQSTKAAHHRLDEMTNK